MEKNFINSIDKLIERDLDKLETEINLYKAEETIWVFDKEIKNSAGNLCLHLCGNLQNYIGAVLGKTGYVRNRVYEFAAKGVPRAELLNQIQQTKVAVKSTLQSLDPAILNQEYETQVLGYPMTTMYFLIHLTAHFEYHLGQINYHRRLLS
ncbi:MAG TPA: DUF1572 family protein [Cyclobacteriaceae bacterium]|nr:DUF1572 family protein [Cyclobacteriaceae bacterium]